MNEENIFTGVLLDERSEEQKQTEDVQLAELLTSSLNPVNWVEKSISEIRKFPIYNQGQSGSCVAQTIAKMWGIMYWLKNKKEEYVHGSATHVYQRRSNKPAGGMNAEDAFAIASQGVTLEELVHSENMSDAEMDAVKIPQYKIDVGQIFKFGKPINLPMKDIEAIASVIQTTEKGVMVWLYWNSNEWTTVPTIKNPNLDLYAPATPRHSVTAVDFTLLGQKNVPNNPEMWGKKALVIDDSWGSSYGAAGQRFITEDFFSVRNWYARYVQNFKFDVVDEDTSVPNNLKHNFLKTLTFIEWDSISNQPKNTALDATQNVDVKALQDILKFEGVMPVSIGSSGYYGALTAKSVLELQKKYNVAPLQDLVTLGGKSVGPLTLSFLNQKYGN